MIWKQFQTFQKNHPIYFRIVLSILIGLVLEISVAALPFPTLKFVRQSADHTTDLMTRFAVFTRSEPASGPHFAFVDIDQKSWLAWAAPLVVPRNKIQSLLSRVAESKPAMIILDVDLSFRDVTSSEEILQSYLETYPSSAPPLILVRALQPSQHSKYPEPRNTQYDQIVSRTLVDGRPAHPNIFWALPSFERGDDGIVRRWQLAVVACDAAAPRVIPSLQLQAVWLWLGMDMDKPATFLSPLRPGNCNDTASTNRTTIPLSADPFPIISVNSEDTSSRVIYNIAWRPDSLVLGPIMRDGSNKVVLRSADAVSRIPPGEGVNGIEGAIVVIGGSFLESGDWFQTPLGRMPGALVLINAIDELARHGTPADLIFGQRLALSLSFILFVSICVGWFRSLVAAFLSLMGFGVFMFATLSMFKSGIIADLAIPSIGILIVDLIFSSLRIIRGFRKKGWRWILKSSQTINPDIEERI